MRVEIVVFALVVLFCVLWRPRALEGFSGAKFSWNGDFVVASSSGNDLQLHPRRNVSADLAAHFTNNGQDVNNLVHLQVPSKGNFLQVKGAGQGDVRAKPVPNDNAGGWEYFYLVQDGGEWLIANGDGAWGGSAQSGKFKDRAKRETLPFMKLDGSRLVMRKGSNNALRFKKRGNALVVTSERTTVDRPPALKPIDPHFSHVPYCIYTPDGKYVMEPTMAKYDDFKTKGQFDGEKFADYIKPANVRVCEYDENNRVRWGDWIDKCKNNPKPDRTKCEYPEHKQPKNKPPAWTPPENPDPQPNPNPITTQSSSGSSGSRPDNAIESFEITYKYDLPNDVTITNTTYKFIQVYFVPFEGRAAEFGCKFGGRPEILNDSNGERAKRMKSGNFKPHEKRTNNVFVLRWDTTTHSGRATVKAQINNNTVYEVDVPIGRDGSVGWPNERRYMKYIDVTYSWMPGSRLTNVDATVKINGQDLGSWNRGKPNPSKLTVHGAVQKTYDWQAGGWGSCVGSCAQGRSGTQRRDVKCRSSDGEDSADSQCTRAKPSSEKSCNYDCPSSWVAGQWANCAPSNGKCGPGRQTREIKCKSNQGNEVSQDWCSGQKPDIEQDCNAKECTKWTAGDWGQCVPAQGNCGAGAQKRTVDCTAEGTGQSRDLGACQGLAQKPVDSQNCRINCPSYVRQWGEWSNCSTSCGKGKKTQVANCIDENTQMLVDPALCTGPMETEQECESTSDCTYEVRWGDWTPCDTQCGAGRQTQTGQCFENGVQVENTKCEGKGLSMINTQTCAGRNCTYESKWGEWGQCRAANGDCGAGTKTRSHECYQVVNGNRQTMVGGEKCGDWFAGASAPCEVECTQPVVPQPVVPQPVVPQPVVPQPVVTQPVVTQPVVPQPVVPQPVVPQPGGYVWSNPDPICQDRFGQSPICYPSSQGSGIANFDAQYSMKPDSIYCMDRITGFPVDGKLCRGEKPTRCTPETMPGLDRCGPGDNWRRLPSTGAGSGALGTSVGRNLAQTNPVQYARSMLGLPQTMSDADVQKLMLFRWNTDDTWGSCVGQTCADVGGGVHKMKGGTRSRDVLCDLVLTQGGAPLPAVNTNPTYCPTAKPAATEACGEGRSCDPLNAGRTAAEMLGQAPAAGDAAREFEYERPLAQQGFAWSPNSQKIDFPGETPSRWFSDKTAGRGRGKLQQMFGDNFPEWKDKYGEVVKPASTDPGVMYKVDLESTQWKDCKLKSGSQTEIEECYLDRVGIMPANSVLSGY